MAHGTVKQRIGSSFLHDAVAARQKPLVTRLGVQATAQRKGLETERLASPHDPKEYLKHPLAIPRQVVENALRADVAKLVDARDLKSLGAICTGSTPVVRTRHEKPVASYPKQAGREIELDC